MALLMSQQTGRKPVACTFTGTEGTTGGCNLPWLPENNRQIAENDLSFLPQEYQGVRQHE
jgi:hypothetical protein